MLSSIKPKGRGDYTVENDDENLKNNLCFLKKYSNFANCTGKSEIPDLK